MIPLMEKSELGVNDAEKKSVGSTFQQTRIKQFAFHLPLPNIFFFF